MWSAFYQGNPLLFWPLFAMGGFIAVFVVAVVRAWRAGDGDARLPLDDIDDERCVQHEQR